MQRRKLDNISDKQELRKYITTSIRTTMIGSLSAFEEQFGYLWGHGNDPKDRTEEQQYMFILWQEVRSNILDLGNNSIDIANRSTNKYNISKKGFYKEF